MKKLLLTFMALAVIVTPLYANTPGTVNLWQGVISLNDTTGDNWQNTSLITWLPGQDRLENTAATTLRVQIGFSTIPLGAATVDIASAKLITTLKGSNKITAIQDLKFNTAVPPYSLPLSTTCTVAVTKQNPCFFVFDTSTITTKNSNDYYIILAFQNTVNNASAKLIKVTDNWFRVPMICWFQAGNAATGLIVGSLIPAIPGNTGLWGIASITF
jgi:hypothetical protein